MMLSDTLVPGAGIGLRSPHIDAVLKARPPVSFLEVHAENHMGDGRAFQALASVRQDNAVSVHGVGLSLGGAEPPDPVHLSRFVELVQRIEPVLVSEHLSWCRVDGLYLNDLLPVRYDRQSLDAIARNIDIVQRAIARRILIENPSHYVGACDQGMSEIDFISALCSRTGCGLLLDVNNVAVSARNMGYDAAAWLDDIPVGIVGQIHLAGHEDDGEVLIDTHGAPVCDAVWDLYARALRRFGRVPTLIERDQNIPPLDDLIAEAHRADTIASALHREDRHAAAA
jgi:uncharacterized protein (UPF0276 family)